MLSENPTDLLSDFGVDVVAGSTTGQGILDMPSEILIDGQVLNTDYTLTCESSKFGDLIYGAQLTANGVSYTVRSVNLVADGLFVQISLQRDLETPHTTSLTPIDGNGAAGQITALPLIQLDPDIDGGSALTTYIDGNEVDGGAA